MLSTEFTLCLEPVVEDAKNYLLDERNHNIGSKAYLDKLGLEQK